MRLIVSHAVLFGLYVRGCAFTARAPGSSIVFICSTRAGGSSRSARRNASQRRPTIDSSLPRSYPRCRRLYGNRQRLLPALLLLRGGHHHVRPAGRQVLHIFIRNIIAISPLQGVDTQCNPPNVGNSPRFDACDPSFMAFPSFGAGHFARINAEPLQHGTTNNHHVVIVRQNGIPCAARSDSSQYGAPPSAEEFYFRQTDNCYQPAEA